MLPIEDLMVDARCVATIGGRRLFCFNNFQNTKFEIFFNENFK
jgi:hypothetical protein